jgi:hypothetical protein
MPPAWPEICTTPASRRFDKDAMVMTTAQAGKADAQALHFFNRTRKGFADKAERLSRQKAVEPAGRALGAAAFALAPPPGSLYDRRTGSGAPS